MRRLVLFAFLVGCCPGFFPLLEDGKRTKTFEEPTAADADEGRRRLVAWMSSPRSGRSGGPAFAEFIDVVDSPTSGTVTARYSGRCMSPPADPSDDPWRLTFDLEAKVDDRKVRLTFSRVTMLWPTLGDNPSVLTHGHKRAPRTEQDMADITAHCLSPLRSELVTAMGTPPSAPLP